jgi:hypothetical protein
LTPVAAEIWRLLKLKYSLDQIADHVAAEFEAPREQVYQDLREFVGSLTHHRLLVSGNTENEEHRQNWVFLLILRWYSGRHSKARTKSVHFLFWKATCALLAFDLFGFGNNFAAMHEFVRSWVSTHGPSHPEALDRVCRAVDYACIWYPKRVLCLQRSAVTTCLLRSCGVSAEMVIGAQTFPFKAHAWTEVNGIAVNERRDVHRIYLVWERY